MVELQYLLIIGVLSIGSTLYATGETVYLFVSENPKIAFLISIIVFPITFISTLPYGFLLSNNTTYSTLSSILIFLCACIITVQLYHLLKYRSEKMIFWQFCKDPLPMKKLQIKINSIWKQGNKFVRKSFWNDYNSVKRVLNNENEED